MQLLAAILIPRGVGTSIFLCIPVAEGDLTAKTATRVEWGLKAFTEFLRRRRHLIRKSALGGERRRRGLVRLRPEVRGVLVAAELEDEELQRPLPAGKGRLFCPAEACYDFGDRKKNNWDLKVLGCVVSETFCIGHTKACPREVFITRGGARRR